MKHRSKAATVSFRYQPMGQPWQPLPYLPGAQDVQEAMLGFGVNDPALHSLQLVLAALALNFPVLQVGQSVKPSVSPKVPGRQGKHDADAHPAW